MKAGAVDFLEKPFEKGGAPRCRGEGLRAACARAIASTLSATEAAVQLASLTSRERDVVEGLIEGQPNKVIAFNLGISPRTVEIHRANLMRKLGATSLSQVLQIGFAAQRGTVAETQDHSG